MKTRILPILITFAFVCVGLLPKAQALSPPPPGGYPNFTTAAGDSALSGLTSGAGNTGFGWFALGFDQVGSFNTAVGAGALDLNTADSNTAVGASALLLNTTGTLNTATGVDALTFNATGGNNTANGAFALFSNTTGNDNTAVGESALYENTTGFLNTAIGWTALFRNTTSGGNTAVGIATLQNNTTGGYNTANGAFALFSNTTGNSNTTNGTGSLYSNTTGSDNTAIGANAGANVVTAGNVTCIGSNVAGANVSNTTWIGGVYGVTTQSGTTAPVVVSDSGQLGTAASSERFKKDIATMEKASEAVLSLRPVSFHYKTDTKDTPQFGLIAEEVAKVNSALVLPDKEGKPYTVRYDAVNAMLLNEFLKEHHQVQDLKAIVAGQQKQIETLTAGLQKVSAQLEASKPAPQVVNNP